MSGIDLRFGDQVAVVTGASRGIGLAIAERLVAEGARVVVTGRREADLRQAVERLGGEDRALGVPGHADDPDHQAAAIGRAISTFGRLDVLVNNVGVNPAFGPLLAVPDDAAKKILQVNVLGTLAWVRSAHERWLGANGGTVVNVASAAGMRPSPGIGMYGSSKSAVMYLTRQLALELAPRIRVNAVAPAVVRTRFAGPLFDGQEDVVRGRYPLQRLGQPEDVASAVAFLASDDAGWMTGQTLVIDGGLSTTGGV